MIISIVNQKGGTAKTTTAVNFAVGLSVQGKQVLTIDFDAQGNLSFCFGIKNSKKEISSLILEESTFEEVVVRQGKLDVIPSTIALSDLELSLAGYEDRAFLLQKALNKFHDQYDFVIIDCPPSLSLLTINALVASNKVIIPLQLSVLGIQGLDMILDTISNVKKNFNESLVVEGVLPVMVDMRKKLSSEVLEHIKENYSVPVFDTKIRNSVRAMEAPSFAQSVIEFAPKSTTATDYIDFVTEFLKKK